MRIEQIGAATLINADCRVAMAALDSNSVDMVLCDLPYGTTQNKWDTPIPLAPLWEQYRRVCKGAIVLTASQPFTSAVVASNYQAFRYAWVWEKGSATGHLNAHRMPMKLHEDILVFGGTIYNPQDLMPYNKITRRGNSGTNFGDAGKENLQASTNFPRSILRFPREGKPVHPTQKPVALMEYLIRTYTDADMTVLDNCMGSGSTGVACMNSGRNFIGIELDEEHGYFDIACARIRSAVK